MATITETAGAPGMTMEAPPTPTQHRARPQLDEAQFAALVRARWGVSLTLTAVMLAIYFGFIMVLAFRRDLLQTAAGGGMTLGIPVGFGIILTASALTGVYVWWANRRYDGAVRRIIATMHSGGQSAGQSGQTMKETRHG